MISSYQPDSPFADQFAESNRDIIRLKVVYSRDPTVHLVFTIFSTGNLINLACGVLESNIRCQMLLPIRDFVVPFTLTAKDTAIVPQHVFRNLQTLTIRIKDELLEPVLVAIHAQLGLPERLLLCTLPSEILTRILILLPLSALGKLMLASSNMRRQIVNCSPVWRIHLSRLNAKNQSMLDAALTRQRQQQQRQQQQQAPSPSAPAATSAGAIDPSCDIATDTVPHTIPDSLSLASEEHSLSDVEPDNGVTCLYYERFVARYRSLLTQRRCRGLSPSFV
ncbi:hypothetical protein D915_001790 [Fasciola hepatica]|uniref:F-box domain-containing protein n=1 Tax=Fasciola hepatica TaxID=6192 RepID=A0A4E0RHZ5_FASHE|nr:hypothetical protein D915_001790 [Fasciola hepatica]